MTAASRSPHGERGLKSSKLASVAASNTSLPSRGAWIEILSGSRTMRAHSRRSPHGERGLKCTYTAPPRAGVPSLPSRGAWIEMVCLRLDRDGDAVAPLTGSVD